MTDRYYTAGTVEALFMLSRGHCYEPSCRARVMKSINETWQITVHIAHIRGLKENSARYRGSAMTDRERNHFRNLLLLCKTHHVIVDNKSNEHEYTVDKLTAWKEAVEGSHAADLDELDWLTENKLQSLMELAITKTHAVIVTAIENVHNIGCETLALVKNAVSESITRPYIDADTAASLEYSAKVFEHLPSHAELLHLSTRDLRNLPDSSEMLLHSSRGLREATQHTETLLLAAQALDQFSKHIPDLVASSDRLVRATEMVEILEIASRRVDSHRLETLTGSLSSMSISFDRLSSSLDDTSQIEHFAEKMQRTSENIREAATVIEPEAAWSWKSFNWGMAVCLLLVIVVLVLYTIGVARA